jgi:hypothetical protein
VAVVAALMGGLGYGGWNLLLDIQRVEFAPANEAPEVAMAPGGIALATLSMSALANTPHGYDAGRDAALVALYAPQEPAPPAIELRDGPINAIDPESAGVFATDSQGDFDTRVAGLIPGAPDAARHLAGPSDLAEAARLIAAKAEAAPAPVVSDRSGVWIVASGAAWLRVRLADGNTLVQRIFQRGDRFQVPDGVRGAQMRAGNAGAVYIEIDGRLHGPVGVPGGVAKAVSLDADAVRARFDLALSNPLAAKPQVERAEAKLTLE